MRQNLESIYKKEDGKVLIEIKLLSVQQLFNSFDPAPFHEKELDRDAVQYIEDSVMDFPMKTQFRIVVYLPAGSAESSEGREIPAAISNHFRYMAMMEQRRFQRRWVYGQFTILVGLTFLALAMIASRIVSVYFSEYSFAQLIANALEVAGWVAMWEPVTVHLYQLWPIIKMKKIYEKISTTETVVLPIV